MKTILLILSLLTTQEKTEPVEWPAPKPALVQHI